MNTALRVESVSKQYRMYDHPGDRLKEMLTRGLWKRHREFWALQDISFEIEAGTTTGIIGPNGSGKSTLLQIITGTLEPTHGTVWHEGRIAALLELGAGFNPEFTGLENVFMNAALIGFSRSETESLIPEIERFAEIGAFIHQPVKTYSSGMYVRLAFSIAISASLHDTHFIQRGRLQLYDGNFSYLSRLTRESRADHNLRFNDPALQRAPARSLLQSGR